MTWSMDSAKVWDTLFIQLLAALDKSHEMDLKN